MKRIVFCLGLYFFSFLQPGTAQVNISMGDYAGFLRDQNLREQTYSSREEKNYLGTPYLQDTFQKGDILMRNNVKYTGIPLRYNIYLDELEFKGKNEEIWALSNPEMVELIEIGPDRLSYRPYTYGKRIQQGFFLVLEEGKMDLLRRPKKFMQKPQQPGAYKDPQPAKFIDRPDEYYLQGFNQAAKLVAGKKELLSLFPDRQKEMAAFIKKNKVKTSKPEKLVELVRYYNLGAQENK
jgi:hypothetical protein